MMREACCVTRETSRNTLHVSRPTPRNPKDLGLFNWATDLDCAKPLGFLCRRTSRAILHQFLQEMAQAVLRFVAQQAARFADV